MKTSLVWKTLFSNWVLNLNKGRCAASGIVHTTKPYLTTGTEIKDQSLVSGIGPQSPGRPIMGKEYR